MDKTQRGLIAWCFYDWANSAFPTVITTFVFAAYFTKQVAPDTITGTNNWGVAISISALAVAISGPVFGAVADATGHRKPWLLAFTLIAALAAAMLWTVEPTTAFVLHALFWVALANFAFEMGMIFYNAMLVDIAPAERLGRWSGWGWGFGYLGGLTCLGLILVTFIQTETPPFGLNKEAAEELRITGPFVAVWMLLFALPLFFITADKLSTGKAIKTAIKEGVKTLIYTLRKLPHYRNLARFLLARMLYTDGLTTLFAFGGIYAAGTFRFSFEDLIVFGIGMNIAAGLGAIGFAWLDDGLGSKRVIMISVASLTLLGSSLLIIEDITLFWICSLTLGLFVGSAQSASRSLMARLAPTEMIAEFFGLYALSGKATAFLGPAVLAWATIEFESQRAGMATIILFFLTGLIIMIKVPSGKH